MQEFEITLETAPGKTELVLIPEQTKLEQIAKRYHCLLYTSDAADEL